MVKKDFYDSQTNLTASKILIYRQYLNSFLPKVLMQYGKCYVADFFCGRGKNGNANGSPLVLLDVAKQILESSVIKAGQPNAEIVIVFSDADQECCDDLKAHLKSMSLPAGIKVFGPFCEDFKSIKTKAINTFQTKMPPKFFFLDPFTYSAISIDDVKDFMNVPAAEVLLFLPTFHSYRFVKCSNEVGKLKLFLDNFTDKGSVDYKDINDFNESIRQRLLKYIGLKYVRAVGLDDGATKNALFYLTKHITGMLLMNTLVWKHAYDGVTMKAKRDNETALFDLSTLSGNFVKMKEIFQGFVKDKKQLTNIQIIDFVAENCFVTSYANEILKEMKRQEQISVEYKKSDKTRGFYVADNNWDHDLATIIYRG